MELFQVYWDDYQNLNLEFGLEQESFQPDQVERINLKYEISKCGAPNGYYDDIPSLVSIKSFNIIDDKIIFSLDLDQLVNPEELEIEFLQLRLFLNSGKSVNYRIGKRYELSEICYDTVIFEEVENRGHHSFNSSLTQEKVYAKSETNLIDNTETKTVIYQKNQAKLSSNNLDISALLQENNKRLALLEECIRELTSAIKNNNLQCTTSNNLLPPPPPSTPSFLKKPNSSSSEPIVRIRKPPPSRLGAPTSSKLLFIGELKSLIQSTSKSKGGEFNFRDILKPLSEEELKEITLDEEELCKRELEFFSKNTVVTS
ncbi:MAG: hypothetical protein ACTSR8_19580 [Promethearchaeota archaeon]